MHGPAAASRPGSVLRTHRGKSSVFNKLASRFLKTCTLQQTPPSNPLKTVKLPQTPPGGYPQKGTS